MSAFEQPTLGIVIILLAIMSAVAIGPFAFNDSNNAAIDSESGNVTVECSQIVEDGQDTVVCFTPSGVSVEFEIVNGTNSTQEGESA